ncbi:MAG: hypothetical protein PHP74_03830 [Candidatus Gracilibacteria bacterium]|nr:hypothetical protein [Candidatus Gracilibacteria bacterium]
MPSPEKPGNKECVSYNNPERLAEIQNKLSVPLFQESGSTQRLPKKIKLSKGEVIHYDTAIFGKDIKDYYRYISSNIDSVEDIMSVLTNLITYYTDPQGRLYNAETVLVAGFGDCDNYSMVAKRLLEDLGCKKNFDYNPRIIALYDHAVCIFTDEKGERYSIDQNNLIKMTDSIYSASSIFEKSKDTNLDSLREVELYSDEVSGLVYLDKDLNHKKEKINITIYGDYDGTFEFEKLLPKDYAEYEVAQVRFGNNFFIFYKKGVLHQKYYPDSSPVRADSFYKNGSLAQRKYADGSVHFFLEDGKTIVQKVYPEGNIEVEFFDEKGRLAQRGFREGNVEVEFFDKEGNVVQRKFRKTKNNKYKIVWYGKNGEEIQREDFNGKVAKVK